MNKEPFSANRLFCPGPTPKPKNISGIGQDIYHRSAEFSQLFVETASLLKELVGADENPLLLASSGTGAMEAAVVNFTNLGDEVLVLSAGKFGERWLELNKVYGNHVHSINLDWGKAVSPLEVKKVLQANPKITAVFIQANETSTGVHHPIKEIANAIKGVFKGLFIVDGISSIGAHRLHMVNDGIDVIVGGSQKGFGVAPGLSFIGASQKSCTRISDRPRFYFDLRKERKGQATGVSAFTPAISLVQEIHFSLMQMQELGFDNVAAHHLNLGNACRKAMLAIGLELFAESHHSNALTAVKVPEGLDGTAILNFLKQKFGFYFGGGQDHVKGKIIRISHLGFVNRFDLIDGIAGFEFALQESGYKFDFGLATKTALTILHTENELFSPVLHTY